ncbi:centrosomal protein 20 isoform X6 [Ovis aries]|uniref:centrosomal protein 20 isoform X6 n=1 Tax=Ovis aries TaxID=9940 RepID=UPI0005FC0ED5|nr:centrosomal protein 20 isoform X6 [Ovis aries]
MATVAELKAVLKDTLEKRGVLGHLKARIRAEVFSALDDESEPRPSLSHENFLINELIREYLEFNKYKYTASVLIAESGQPVVPLDRQFLIHELNAFEDSKNNTIPLLYGILAHFLHGTKDDNKNTFLKGSSLQPLNPNLGRPPSGRKQMVIGEGNGDPLQYSCLENSMDRGTWWAAVCGVTQSWTRLKRLSSSSSIGGAQAADYQNKYKS